MYMGAWERQRCSARYADGHAVLAWTLTLTEAILKQDAALNVLPVA